MSEVTAQTDDGGLALAEPDAPAALAAREAIEAWDQALRGTALLLRAMVPDAAWLVQALAASERQSELARRDPDVALYLLMQAAGSETERYSAHHSMLCALVATLCATGFGWPPAEIEALSRAALTMNLSMTAAQDTLSRQTGPLTPQQREQIDSHAERSAQMLEQAGVGDALWIEVVRRHHAQAAAGPDAAPADRLAHLLHRVDVYTAKLSGRATRAAVSPAIAARDACLDASGRPDPLGGAILRALGLYPPGTCVRLVSGEVAVVIRRGAKAHTPVVAGLRRADGGTHLRPVLRDTRQAAHAVQQGVRMREVKVWLNHLRVLLAV
jgi:hypothetical protein